MDIASVALIVMAAIVIAGIWYAGTRLRARTVGAAQLDTNHQLAEIGAQLADINGRLGHMERVIREAE